MSTLGERVRAARNSAHMTQAELARRVGARSGAVISSWEKDINKPNADYLAALCAVLRIEPSYLLDYYGGRPAERPPVDALSAKYRQLDSHGRRVVDMVLDAELERVRSQRARHDRKDAQRQAPPKRTRLIRFVALPVSAGTGMDLDADNTEESIEIPLDNVSEKADFVLSVSGDSMAPAYDSGDLILIQSAEAIDPGELGVFGLNGDGYFKKLGDGELVSLNRKYRPIQFEETDDIRCFGRVLGKTERVRSHTG